MVELFVIKCVDFPFYVCEFTDDAGGVFWTAVKIKAMQIPEGARLLRIINKLTETTGLDLQEVPLNTP